MATIQETSSQVSIRDTILATVNTQQGIKAVELVLNVLGSLGHAFDDREYLLELSRLIQEGEVIEFEYVLPNLDYRIKSIYFPKGTVIYASKANPANDGSIAILPRI